MDSSVPEHLESKARYFGWHKLDKFDFTIEEEKYHPGLFILKFPFYQWYIDNGDVVHEINKEGINLRIKTESKIDDSQKYNNNKCVEKENDNMKAIKTNIMPLVTNVQTFNDRVVKVTFADGSFTKAICAKDDVFNIDTGIMVCLIRRMIAKDADSAGYAFNRLMSDIHHTMEKNEKKARKEREKLAKEKAERKAINKKRQEKNEKERAESLKTFTGLVKAGVLSALEYRDEHPDDQAECDKLNNLADAVKVGVLNAFNQVKDEIEKELNFEETGADE